MSQSWTPTQEQQAAVFESAIRGQRTLCPRDNAAMERTLTPHSGELRYQLVAHCPKCNDNYNFDKTHDPQGGNFREWSEAEKKAIVDDHFGNPHRTIACPLPNCGAPLNIVEANTHRMINCWRCDNQHYHRPDEG